MNHSNPVVGEGETVSQEQAVASGQLPERK